MSTACDVLMDQKCSRRLAGVLGLTESENREENKSQKSKADSKAGAFSEFLSNRDIHHDRDDDISDRNKEKDNPPKRFVGDLKHDDDIVNGDDTGPSGLAGFGEDFLQ